MLLFNSCDNVFQDSVRVSAGLAFQTGQNNYKGQPDYQVLISTLTNNLHFASASVVLFCRKAKQVQLPKSAKFNHYCVIKPPSYNSLIV